MPDIELLGIYGSLEDWERIFAAASSWLMLEKTVREALPPGSISQISTAKEGGRRIAPHLLKLAMTTQSIPGELW